ncbi:MAG TPA: RsmE family RNA methyltransferase [Bacilli bacterium]|nr:RsmE family RNA methyltransferase [Bacilli bacterium]
MQRYFAINKKLELTNQDIFHITRVMRMKKEDSIEVIFDEILYNCKIKNIKPFELDIISSEKIENKDISIILGIPILKEQKMDYIFQKATEIGVSEFQLVYTDRALIKNENNNKINRWNMICKEASEQSKRINIPKISKPISIKEFINIEADLKLICSLSEKTENIKKVLQKSKTCDRILVITGPEGGFTDQEEKILLNNGFIPITFGNMVLRAETAPIYIMSILKYEFMR